MKEVYLAGSMEYSPDEGLGWRTHFSDVLGKEFGFKCIIPNEKEKEIKKDIDFKKLKRSDIKKYISIIRQFIEMDLKFVENVDMIIVKWEGEKTSGTTHEVGYAYQLKKPTYLVTSMPLWEVPGWFLACFTEVFSSLEELVEYLRG